MNQDGCAGVVMIAPSWSTFLEELRFGPHPTSIRLASAGVHGRFLQECWGETHSTVRMSCAHPHHAVVEDTVDN